MWVLLFTFWCTYFKREFIIHVVKYFGNSLKYGNQHIYQSLPRLLSLWLDYGAVAVDTKKRESSEQQRRELMRINEVMLLFSIFIMSIVSLWWYSHPQSYIFSILFVLAFSSTVTHSQDFSQITSSVSTFIISLLTVQHLHPYRNTDHTVFCFVVFDTWQYFLSLILF